jgi:hypothetical protein
MKQRPVNAAKTRTPTVRAPLMGRRSQRSVSTPRDNCRRHPWATNASHQKPVLARISIEHPLIHPYGDIPPQAMLTPSQNFTLDERDTSLRFVFPHRDPALATLWTVASVVIGMLIIGMLIFGFIMFALPETQSGIANPGPIFWLESLAFLIAGASFFVEIFWYLNGQEIVEINQNGISIRHQVFGFNLTKNFSAQEISCVFASRRRDAWVEFNANLRYDRFFIFRHGKIAFNIGATLLWKINTQRFAVYLDPNESRQIVALIRHKFPQYRCPAHNPERS